MKRENPQRKEKNEEKSFRAYFLRLFGKYDLRNEHQLIHLGKWLIFIVLLVVETLMLLRHINEFDERGGWRTLIAILVIGGILAVSQSLKLFVIKRNAGRIPLYVLDALAACWFVFLTSGTYPIVVCMLILTEFYLNTQTTKPCVILLAISVALYTSFDFFRAYVLIGGTVDLFPLLTQSFATAFALVVHFVIVQVALAFYRQFLRLDKVLKELAESQRELEKAYERVAEVTALEERQRIAKEIHDTAGHSITTVIMQTESAKLMIERSPEEAKNKIVAANLQAKHALEELRDSVHLLSGNNAGNTLKSALENIVHESTDGTGITIRSEIEDVAVSPAKFRFLCNTLKEGISNGLRHGNATAFWFELKIEDGKICFLLSDNGKGLEKDWKAGFGLTSLRERARSFGGEAEFVSEPDEGFEIRLTLPMDALG